MHRGHRRSLHVGMAVTCRPFQLKAQVALCAAAFLIAAVFAAPSASAATRPITLGGVRVQAADARQVATVNRSSGTHAIVALWEKRSSGWTRVISTKKGRIGYGGLVPAAKRRQGTGTTPVGTFTITESFGNKGDPGTRLPYHMVRSGDYWVEDNASRYYNYRRNKSQGGFRWWLPASNVNGSEHLPSFRTQYAYSIVMNFNRPHPVRYRGAGIFLHVNGRGATAGCVGAPEWFVKGVLTRLDPARRPRIAVGY
jgi:L,D-peptidoglycan transpeptidase YkuD (ErfK/YbiS/YcfS/YnhG family)